MARRRRGKVYGTPTGVAQPQGIDDWSGFKVNHADLKLEWDKLRTTDPDIRNPQDFVKGVKDNQNLPWARPEAPDVFMAQNLLTEDLRPIFTQGGAPLFTEGQLVTAESL